MHVPTSIDMRRRTHKLRDDTDTHNMIMAYENERKGLSNTMQKERDQYNVYSR